MTHFHVELKNASETKLKKSESREEEERAKCIATDGKGKKKSVLGKGASNVLTRRIQEPQMKMALFHVQSINFFEGCSPQSIPLRYRAITTTCEVWVGRRPKIR